MPGYHPRFIRRCSVSFRILFCALFSALSCTSVMPQGSCCSTPHNIWGMSGYSGPNWLAPESDPNWQQLKANEMAQNGGIPSVTKHHIECEQSAGGLALTKENKCACHCIWAPQAPPGQGCIDACLNCYSKSPTPYDACICFSKQLAGRTNEQAESDCRALKPRK